MDDKQAAAPDNTAVRVALWRALHVEVDAPPHVFEDEVDQVMHAVAVGVDVFGDFTLGPHG